MRDVASSSRSASPRSATMPIVKRTYASNRTVRPEYPSSPRSTYSSDPFDPHDAPIAPSSPHAASESQSESAVLGKRKRTTTSAIVPAQGSENVSVNLLGFLVPKSTTVTQPPSAKRKRVFVELSPARVLTTSSNCPATSTSTATTTPAVLLLKKKSSETKKRPPSGSSGKQLTQLHLTLGKSSLRTCPLCSLSYTRGSPDDEDLHKKHCARISRGTHWGKEETRFEGREVTVVEDGVIVRGRDGREETGRIVKFNANVGGKLGAKLATVLHTVNLALSAPELAPETLADSKAYLFLLSSTSPTSTTNTTREREKIVGCVIAQRIQTAMKIVTSPSQNIAASHPPSFEPSNEVAAASGIDLPAGPSTEDNSNSGDDTSLTPITVQFSDDHHDTGLFCSPTPLPTPLGIPRLFVSSSHRHKGIASSLLDAAVRTFIHGCPLRPELGHVAFSQPTRAGRGVMERWGKGAVRIYQE